MTMMDKFEQGLKENGLRIEKNETSFEVYKEAQDYDVWLGIVYWDVMEYEVAEDGHLYNIVIRYWMDDEEGEEICSAYNVEDMIKNILEKFGK